MYLTTGTSDRTPTAYGVSVEQEPIGEDRTRTILTLLLTARRCPIECVFCDLWRHNHAAATPVGSIPTQIEHAIDQMRSTLESANSSETAIKLYNGGNFTDPLSIPPQDWPRIAELCEPFDRVIIENHANMCGDRLLAFRDLISADLEVAIGLETANEAVLAHQQKRMTLADFTRAAEFLQANQISLRCFVLLQLPYADSQHCVADAVETVRYAINAGAGFVTIIPTRSETREMQDLIASGDFVPPTLRQLETALFDSLVWVRSENSNAVVTADEWGIEAVQHDVSCQATRIENIQTMNRTQRPHFIP